MLTKDSRLTIDSWLTKDSWLTRDSRLNKDSWLTRDSSLSRDYWLTWDSRLKKHSWLTRDSRLSRDYWFTRDSWLTRDSRLTKDSWFTGDFLVDQRFKVDQRFLLVTGLPPLGSWCPNTQNRPSIEPMMTFKECSSWGKISWDTLSNLLNKFSTLCMGKIKDKIEKEYMESILFL